MSPLNDAVASERTPLLLGRLKRSAAGDCTLSGHLGDVRGFPSRWYEAVRLMDGFHSFPEIAAATGLSPAEVMDVFATLRGEKRLGFLDEWNRCFFCPSCSLYLAGARACTACGGATRQVALHPPCDPWIFFDEEYRFAARLLEEQAGIAIDDRRLLLGNNGVRDNRFFWQVVYQGEVVLLVDFVEADPESWRATATEAARRVDWRRETPGREQEIERMVAANRSALAELENDAIRFIEEVCEFYPSDPLLYFSGGKESVIMLRLLEKARRKANLVFVGTGVDFPEDAAFLLEQLKPMIDRNPLFHLEVNLAPPEKFIGIFREQGQLDARAAWCRKYIKAPLKAELTDRLYGDAHFVAFEGSRWYENDFRRSHPRVNFARGYEKQIWTHPIANWSGLDVWLYIHAERLPINPMYRLGYQRTTCWLCPIVNPYHLQTSKQQYPALWKKIEGLKLIGFDDGDNLNTPF